MKPNLEEIRKIIFELSKKCIERFSEANKDKVFYAFGFDLNAEYGDVLLCTNTEEEFKKTSQEYIDKWNYTGSDLADLKKNFGDWAYQGFNLDAPEWEESWQPYNSTIQEYLFNDNLDEDEYEAFIDNLIKTCTLALLDLEKSGYINQLNQEDDFYLLIMDHDENEDDAEARYIKIRNEYYA